MSRRARLRGQLEAEIDNELRTRVLPASVARGGLLASASLEHDEAETAAAAAAVAATSEVVDVRNAP